MVKAKLLSFISEVKPVSMAARDQFSIFVQEAQRKEV
jgi:hypothetical protein